MASVRQKAEAARAAARQMAASSDEARCDALTRLAVRLSATPAPWAEANAQDLMQAEKDGLAPALLGRLGISQAKAEAMVDGCRQLAARDDRLGRTLRSTVLDDGLHLYQVTCPLGVLACIFESRPDVVVQISALAIRSGNAVLLKGGKEAGASNEALIQVVRAALEETGLPSDAVQLLDGRSEVQELLAMDDLVDLVVPRGSNELVQHVQENTRIPVLGHADGVCHIYLDAAADRAKAMRIIEDAKLDAPSACNAVETVLVHQALSDWVPELVDWMMAKGITVHQGGAADFGREHGAPELGLGIVADTSAAIRHINHYGSGHTDAIVTEDAAAAAAFVQGVDSAGVFVNASTRFADGYRYGLGAEVGISTGRIHARGPVGVEGLLSTRWILVGHGQTAATYHQGGLRHETSDTSFREQWDAWMNG